MTSPVGEPHSNVTTLPGNADSPAPWRRISRSPTLGAAAGAGGVAVIIGTGSGNPTAVAVVAAVLVCALLIVSIAGVRIDLVPRRGGGWRFEAGRLRRRRRTAVPARPAPAPPRSGAPQLVAARAPDAAVRQWAKQEGRRVGRSGPVSHELRRDYDEACRRQLGTI